MRPKFAIVREDAGTEAAVVERVGAARVLLVASAGDTALTLAGRFPALDITCFDFNPVQLDLVRAKVAASGDPERLRRLDQDGEFEGLFRVLRHFLLEFALTQRELDAFFEGRARAQWLDSVLESPYWPAAFDVAFSDPFLNAMFGPAATQHAAPGSYGPYFRSVFERGLLDPAAASNPFLRHPLQGAFGAAFEPDWYTRPVGSPRLVQGSLLEVPDLWRFDLVSLSNCLDWADDSTASAWGAALGAARSGCVVVLRQLNNTRDIRRFFPDFCFDDALGAALLGADRSLFYNRIEVGVRV